MRHFLWTLMIVVLAFSLVSCTRAQRIANDVNWIIFDGQPSRDN
jgi:hypothetical protein